MPLSMYQASVPAFLQILSALTAILDKAAAHCEAKKIDPSVILNARLFPDMYPTVRQVQIATDHAKGAAARLAGVEVPSYPDTEATFDQLKERIAKTISFVSSVKQEQIDGSENRPIRVKAGPVELNFTGQQYLVNFALPNFYFHASTAYDLLRHNGIDIGKRDFLGAI